MCANALPDVKTNKKRRTKMKTLLLTATFILSSSTCLFACNKENRPETKKEILISNILRVKTCRGVKIKTLLSLKGKAVCNKENKPKNSNAKLIAKILRVKTCAGNRYKKIAEVL